MSYGKHIFAMLTLFSLVGCFGGLGTSFTPPVLLQEIKVIADKDSNDGDATFVDVVMLYDKDLLDRLSNMKSDEYFEKIDELEQNNPGTLERFHFEVVAGSSITEEIKPKSNRAVGALIFAGIHAPGTHRYRVGIGYSATVKLLQTSMEIKEEESFNMAGSLKKSLSWLF